MYVRVRDASKKSGEQDTVILISKCAYIQELRKSIYEKLGVEISNQRLYYKGKQLIDDHRIIDYSIQLNDVIQLLTDMDESVAPKMSNDIVHNLSEIPQSSTSTVTISLEKADSKYYQIDDLVDYLDPENGAWFEGKIIEIFKRPENAEPLVSAGKIEPDLIFRIQNTIDDGHLELNFNEIRPRSYHYFKVNELQLDQVVLANYNVDKANSRGFWYDYQITKMTSKYLQGIILLGPNKTPHEDRTVKFIEEILRIEVPQLLTDRKGPVRNIAARKTAYTCEECKDVQEAKCKHCGCKICGGKNDAAKIILCDECNSGHHINCLDPPLSEIPSEADWYCPDCKLDVSEIVNAGDKLKYSDKKSKMASTKKKGNKRDWGHGMATVGRATECTIVPKHHFGPIPGIEVGTCWGFRVQVSEAGVHRPHVAGIHGNDNGAYSIVLSGGYEDDVDNGDEFIYTGSGGRDLSGNKRISAQSKDQILTRTNRALAVNCNTPISEDGGEAKDWKGGKPVRVVRSYKMQKHSQFAPMQGNRYDGIYKIVKYYPEKGLSGYLVWKFVMRRDDPIPAPWHKGGQELDVIYPDGYIEALEQKENSRAAANGNKRGVKRTSTKSESPAKKFKVQPFEPDDEVRQEIINDIHNKKLWDECNMVCNEGKKKFLEKVGELFMCVCCQELLYQPITMECKHNVCKDCLERSFASEIFNCPSCRLELIPDYVMKVNDSLQNVLLKLFVGYNANR